MALTTSKQINSNITKINKYLINHSAQKKQIDLRVSTVHIIQKNQLTTAKTTHILHFNSKAPQKSQKSKPVRPAPKTENHKNEKSRFWRQSLSYRHRRGARFAYVPFWPECRAGRADRLGYVQTGDCWIGQLLHMRKLIGHSVRDERHSGPCAVFRIGDNADVGVWRNATLDVTLGVIRDFWLGNITGISHHKNLFSMCFYGFCCWLQDLLLHILLCVDLLFRYCLL